MALAIFCDLHLTTTRSSIHNNLSHYKHPFDLAQIILSIRPRCTFPCHNENSAVWKSKQPLQVMKMVALTQPAWQKKTCFQNIASQAYNLATADHPVANIISFVMEEMPTCTVSAFQEAEHVGRLVEKATLHIDNLFPLALLDSEEDELNVDVTAALDKRTEDIAFYKCRSTVDPTKVDGRIKNVGVFSTSFCLPLPYHIYDTSSSSLTLVSPNHSKKNASSSFPATLRPASSSKPSTFASPVDSAVVNLSFESTPSKDGEPTEKSTGTAPTEASTSTTSSSPSSVLSPKS